MSDKFTVEIISPEKSIIKSNTTEVILPSYEGEIGILKDHIPLITFLRPGIIKIINETKKIFIVEEGIVEFANNNLIILSSTVKDKSDVDKKLINDLIIDTEKKIKSHETSDKEKYLLSHKIDTLKNINQWIL